MDAVLTVGVDDDADWCAERRLLAGRRRQHDICCAQPAVASFILTVEGPPCHGLLQMRRPLLVATAPLPCRDDDDDYSERRLMVARRR